MSVWAVAFVAGSVFIENPPIRSLYLTLFILILFVGGGIEGIRTLLRNSTWPVGWKMAVAVALLAPIVWILVIAIPGMLKLFSL